jgi:hypothetical protein
MRKLSLLAAAVFAATAFSTAAPASVYLGTFSGTECSGTGGFPNCWATQTGVQQGPVIDPLGSPAVYKLDSDASTEISPLFPTIDGSEFDISFDAATDVISFMYTAGAGDPLIHYFSVKQADSYILFYDAAGFTSASLDLDTYFPNNPGFSHITFFDTGSGVPEPSTWAMMLLGFGAMGITIRRSRKKAPAAQFA